MERYFDLVIVGAGPAGCTASLYASRAGLSTLLLDNGAPGGKLVKTYEIANYPGVGVSAPGVGPPKSLCPCSRPRRAKAPPKFLSASPPYDKLPLRCKALSGLLTQVKPNGQHVKTAVF